MESPSVVAGEMKADRIRDIVDDPDTLGLPSLRSRVQGVASLFSPVLILVIWEILSRSGVLDSRFFPPPTSIIGTFWELIVSGVLLKNVAATLSRVGVGFLMGAVPGVILGLTLGLFRPVRIFVAPIIAALYPVPKIAMLPLVWPRRHLQACDNRDWRVLPAVL
jgi:NitT/TauT family transport system permease protein